MKTTQDFTAMMKDMMGAFPVDTKAFEESFKNQAALSEKLAAVALEAAEKSAEISNAWTKQSLKNVADVTKAKADASEYTKAVTDFSSASAEMASEHMAAFAEVAKKAQTDTVELLMSAGKEMQEDAAEAVKKATNEVAATAKKATAAK